MILDRRALLGQLGIGSASALLWALGCGGPPRPRATPERQSGEVRTWLRDAVARLHAVFPAVHALAVQRRRTTAAVDVLGAGVARGRRDGAVLVVRDAAGAWREQVTSELTRDGLAAAVRALVGPGARRPASLALGGAPPLPPAPAALDDRSLRARVADITRLDGKLDSRIVYAAAMIDFDDAHVWSIGPGHDREQRLVRVRKRAVRAAWNGTRPVVSEVERGWIGGVDEHDLGQPAVERATEDALLLVTPSAFSDGERTVILEPAVAASLIETGVRALSTSAALRRPEVKARNAGAGAFPAALTLVDDPAAPGAYGGFQFDDEGVPAAPLPLIEAGRLTGVLADRAGGGAGRGRRPGHVGPVEPSPSHLRLVPGVTAPEALRDDGVLLEGPLGAVVDPSSDRIVVGAARAREIRGGVLTGRVHADVELVGELRALLAAVTGLGTEAVTVPYRDELDGEPRWRSVEAVHVRTRGFVRARRRRA